MCRLKSLIIPERKLLISPGILFTAPLAGVGIHPAVLSNLLAARSASGYHLGYYGPSACAVGIAVLE